MRIIPVLIAILVSASLYVLVIKRDAVLAFAAGDDAVAAEEATAQTEPEPERLVSVVALKSRAQSIDSAVLLRGRTEAARQVIVAAETSGKVISEPLRKGTYVEAGQELCRLDPGTRPATLAETEARHAEAAARLPEAEAQLISANAVLTEARINENAARKLSAGGFASETRVAAATAALEQALAAVQSAKAAVEAAKAGVRAADAAVATVKKDIERLVVTAPFSGLLESDTAELGSLMQPGAPCATVIALDPIKLVGFVPETEVDKVEVGELAGARLVTGRDLVGRVTFLSRTADPQTRTFRVEVEVANADLSIRDGQTVEIVISSQGRSAHLLPQSALTLADDGELGVRVVGDGDRAGFVPVTLLRDSVDGVWLAGLEDEADVIVEGQEFVTDGVRVAVTFREAGQ